MTNKPKPFAAYDLDGTLFKSSALEKSIPIAIELGVFDGSAFDDAYLSKEHWQQDNNEGTYNAYIKKLVDAFVGQMKDVRINAFDEVVQELVHSQSIRRYKFTKALIRMVAGTHSNILITGSPTILAKPFIQDITDITRVYGSTFETEDGRYTGAAHSLGSKAAISQRLIDTCEVVAQDSIAEGDTMTDTTMLHLATHPIMFNPSYTLDRYGREFGWDKVIEVKDNITSHHITSLQPSGNGTYHEVELGNYMHRLRDVA